MSEPVNTKVSEPVNTFDQMRLAGGDRVGIFWHGPDYGRGGSCAKWVVIRLVDGVEIPTKPGAPWYDYNRKTFSVFGVREFKKPKLEEAIAWIEGRFERREFVRNRMGDYVERDVNERFPLPKRPRRIAPRNPGNAVADKELGGGAGTHP